MLSMQRLSRVISVLLLVPPLLHRCASAQCPRGSWESFTLNSTIGIPFNSNRLPSTGSSVFLRRVLSCWTQIVRRRGEQTVLDKHSWRYQGGAIFTKSKLSIWFSHGSSSYPREHNANISFCLFVTYKRE